MSMKIFAFSISILVIISIFITSVVYSAPATLSSQVQSQTDDLFSLTKPAQNRLPTFLQYFTLSGVGKPGVTVTFYKREGSNYSPLTDTDGNQISIKIGETGIYWKEIELSYGVNDLLLYAYEDSKAQIVKTEITLMYQNIEDKIKSFKVDPKINF